MIYHLLDPLIVLDIDVQIERDADELQADLALELRDPTADEEAIYAFYKDRMETLQMRTWQVYDFVPF